MFDEYSSDGVIIILAVYTASDLGIRHLIETVVWPRPLQFAIQEVYPVVNTKKKSEWF